MSGWFLKSSSVIFMGAGSAWPAGFFTFAGAVEVQAVAADIDHLTWRRVKARVASLQRRLDDRAQGRGLVMPVDDQAKIDGTKAHEIAADFRRDHAANREKHGERNNERGENGGADIAEEEKENN